MMGVGDHRVGDVRSADAQIADPFHIHLHIKLRLGAVILDPKIGGGEEREQMRHRGREIDRSVGASAEISSGTR